MTKSEPPLSSQLEKIAVAAYTCNREGRITYFNKAAEEVWGRKPKLNNPDELYCGSFKLFWSDGQPMPHNRCWMARALEEGREYNGRDVFIEQPDGKRIHAFAYANPIVGKAGPTGDALNLIVRLDQGPHRSWKPFSSPLRILLVATQRETINLAFLLTAMGYNVKTVTAGVDALQTARKFHPAMIFIETQLPQMNGYEVARMLRRASWGHGFVLVAVNSETLTDPQAARSAGFDHELSRELNVAKVLPILGSLSKH